MIENNKGKINFFSFENLTEHELVNFISTIKSGNMAWNKENNSAGIKNRINFLKALDVPIGKCVFCEQVHGDKITIVDRGMKGIPSDHGLRMAKATDSLVTDSPGICLLVKTADCTPIILFDPVKKVLGVVHAGWRGTLKHISGKTVGVMSNKFSSNPEDIVAAIGPSLGPEHFFIRSDVYKLFEKDGIKPGHMIFVSDDQWLLNIWAINENQLVKAGVLSKNIENCRISTYSSDKFFSFRKKNPEGHFLTGAMIVK